MSRVGTVRPGERHLDLVRNDWAVPQQVVVARIFVSDDAYGLIVKDTASERYESCVFESLGDQAKAPGRVIVERLPAIFHGPYLMVSESHGDAECPFCDNDALPIEVEQVGDNFVLPALPTPQPSAEVNPPSR